jgi:hypothetical protein
MALVLNGDGNVTGLTPGGLPDASITQADLAANVVGNGPAFSAYYGSAQTLSSGVWTKMTMSTETFDTSNCYDASNSRFQPNVAGYYQINGRFGYTPVVSTYIFINIYKNGAQWQRGVQVNSNNSYGGVHGSWLVYLNGSTDYVEIYGHGATGFTTEAGAENVWFSGCLVRAA